MTYFVQVAPNGNISIADGKLNTSDTSLALPGRNASNYGLSLNQNLVDLLQNFASLNAPAHAVLGQLWYDTNGNDLKVYNGSNWSSVTPAWDAYAGSHSIRIPYGIDWYYVTAVVSQNQIVAIYSERAFEPAELPDEVLIAGSVAPYAVSSRFPQGLSQGLTMATENGNLFVMTGVATQAQQLQTGRTIALAGDISGSVKFDGSQDVVINGSLGNLNVAGTYNQVTVDNTGRVIKGNVNLGNADIITALGYTPLGSITVGGDVTAGTNINGSVYTLNVAIANSGVTAGTYNSVTVDQRGIVVAAAVSMDLPQFGIIMWPQTYAVPDNFAICNGQTVTGANNLIIKTPDLRTFTIGTTTFIMRIS
jgi:hypothetical protein